MRSSLSEGVFLVGMAAAATGCREDDSKAFQGQMGSPYEDTGVNDTSGSDTDTDTGTSTDTDSGDSTDTDTGSNCDTDEPCDTGSEVPSQSVITTTNELCRDLLARTSLIDNSLYVDPRSAAPTLSLEGVMSDGFQEVLNRSDVPDAVYRDVFACAEFVPTRCTAEVLGATTTRDFASNRVSMEIEVGAGREGSLRVWIGTLDDEGQMLGYTAPDSQTPQTARNYTVVDGDVIR